MRSLFAGLIAAALTLPFASLLDAQTKTLQGETVTVSATVEAIETATRTVTLKGSKGNYVDVVAPPSVTKFSEIKVGDTITAKYYDNVVVRLKPAGEKSVDSTANAVTKAGGAKPGVTGADQRIITATITAIDPTVPSITFSGPNNWTYSSRVEDKKALATVKVGDKVDITWTAAMLVSFQ
jgi:hypothetical protein